MSPDRDEQSVVGLMLFIATDGRPHSLQHSSTLARKLDSVGELSTGGVDGKSFGKECVVAG